MEPPGAKIRTGFLEPLGLDTASFARGMGLPVSVVDQVLANELPIDAELAGRLGAFFSVPARWFLLMQAHYDAERVDADPRIRWEVTPYDVGPDWLLTPDGALPVGRDPGTQPPAGPRTVTFSNGSVALLSGDP